MKHTQKANEVSTHNKQYSLGDFVSSERVEWARLEAYAWLGMFSPYNFIIHTEKRMIF
jgi:hypothetical protein